MPLFTAIKNFFIGESVSLYALIASADAAIITVVLTIIRKLD
jgi:hypothetical protein